MAFQIPEGNLKAAYLKQKFNRIAEKYDLFNDLITQGMHRYWKHFLVQKSGVQRGDRVLDICCGTGDITKLLNEKTGNTGMACGLDFSRNMLAIARHRKNISFSCFIRGDAVSLPFENNSFDAVTVGFGLRNLVNIHDCLTEAKRVLKIGGRFLSLDMGKVEIPLLNRIFTFYFFSIVPKIGKYIYPEEDLFDYFPESSVDFPSQKKLAEILSNYGFTDVRYFNFYLGSVAVHYAVKPD